MFEYLLSFLGKILPKGIAAPTLNKIRNYHTKLLANSAQGNSARAAIQVFLIRLFGAVLAFGLQVFLARWMGAQQYGVFVLVWVTAIMFGGLSCLGLQSATIKFVAAYRTKNQGANLRGILLAAPAIAILMASFIAISGIWVFTQFPGIVSDIYYAPIILAFICLPILALEEIQEGIARSFDMPVVALGPVFVVRPIGILILIYGAYLVGYEPNATTALAAAVLASLASTIIQALLLWVKILGVVKTEIADVNHGDKKFKFQFLTWLKVSLPILLASGFYSLLANTDVLAIGYFLDPENVAIYFAAIKTLVLVHFIQFALRSASAHHFSRYFTLQDMTGLRQYACRLAQWSFWPTLLLAVIMVAGGKYILAMFGAQFADGQILLAILALGIVARSVIGPAESLLSMCGQQNALVFILAATLTSNILLNIILIPIYGITGAAVATSVAMILETITLYLVVLHRLGFSLSMFKQGPLTTDKEQPA